jgi:molecular chaperone Hsp33
MFQDYLFYGTDVETRYAFRMIHLTSLVRHAQSLHGLAGAEAELLGQGLLAGILLASILEDEERINLRFHSDNDFTMGIETTRHAVTRGYLEVNPDSQLMTEYVRRHNPVLPWMVRSLRSKSGAGGLFEGISRTDAPSLQAAVNEHLSASYQMKTQVRLDCWTSPKDGQLYASGVIYLELPKLPSSVAQELWSHVDQMPLLRDIFGETMHDPDALSARLIPHQVRAINSVNPSWGCSCSLHSIETMLKKLGYEELISLSDEGKPSEIRCHYCNKFFSVGVDRLRELANELESEQSGQGGSQLLN